MEPASRYLSEDARQTVREAIQSAGGNEVLLAGLIDASGVVGRVLVLTRGHRGATLAGLTAFRALRQQEATALVAIHNHPSGDLTPSDADLAIAGELSQLGVGCLIIDNRVSEAYAVVEPEAVAVASPIADDEIEAVFSPAGALARALPSFEDRPEQRQAALAVAAAFNENQLLLLEAGTGVGKSLAYLMPALAWAVANHEQVIVSTNTLNLQDQLLQSDLPILERARGDAVRAAVMKGRSNYACRRKAIRLRQGGKLLFDSTEEALQADAIFAWLETTSSGDRAELTFPVAGGLWSKVAAEGDTCLRLRCQHHATCFYYRARRAAASAHLVIANHALLFSDLALRRRLGDFEHGLVLPPTTRLVLDEAHHIEDTAARHFGTEVSRFGILRLLGRLVSTRDSRRGVLPFLGSRLPELVPVIGATLAAELVGCISGELTGAVDDTRGQVRQQLDLLDGAVLDLARELGAATERSGGLTLRLSDRAMATAPYRLLHAAGIETRRRLASLTGRLRPIVGQLEEAADEDPLVLGEVAELGALATGLAGVTEALDHLLPEPGSVADPEHVRWVERREGDRGPVLHLVSAPVEVAGPLAETLHGTHHTVVMTSATLSIQGAFHLTSERLGLTAEGLQERVRTLAVASPFPYAEHCQLALPTDLPAPDQPGVLSQQAELCAELLAVSRGGAFVLCTSYRALNELVDLLEPRLIASGLIPLVQGRADRVILLEQFRAAAHPVLFGTDSFWEGVDVRGDALRLVIIHRLPFRPPTQPLEEARVEAIAAAGRNGFWDYSLPRAILRLKQGFGRLIRTTTDRGVVVILDNRVTSRRYGNRFLAALPPARRIKGDSRLVIRKVREFFESFDSTPSPDVTGASAAASEPRSGN